MGSTKNSFGKPIYDDVYSFPQDTQDAVDFAEEFAWVRGGTSAERQALPVAQQRSGMLWSETDTGRLLRTDGAGAWGQLDDSGWIAPTLVGGWGQAQPETEPVGYRRLNGAIHFRGRPSGGSGTAFTLPAGFRPATVRHFAVRHGATTTVTFLSIQPTGQVNLTSGFQPDLGGVAPFPAEA